MARYIVCYRRFNLQRRASIGAHTARSHICERRERMRAAADARDVPAGGRSHRRRPPPPVPRRRRLARLMVTHTCTLTLTLYGHRRSMQVRGASVHCVRYTEGEGVELNLTKPHSGWREGGLGNFFFSGVRCVKVNLKLEKVKNAPGLK